MSNQAPWLTVVIPTRDRPELLLESVGSVRRSGMGVAVVVVDDRSAEDSRQVAHALACEGVVVLDGAGIGPSAARNLGVAHADTEWIAFLDDDDVFESAGLQALRNAAGCTGQVGLVFASVDLVRDRSGPSIQLAPHDLGPAFRSVKGQYIPGGFCVRRSVFCQVGGYEERLWYSENTELVLRLVEHCFQQGYAIESTDVPFVRMWRRPPSQRRSSRAEHKLYAARFFLEERADLIASDMRFQFLMHRIAGVSSARLRDRRGAIMHLREAWSRSGDRKDFIRVAVARTPGVWRLVWRPDGSRSGLP